MFYAVGNQESLWSTNCHFHCSHRPRRSLICLDATLMRLISFYSSNHTILIQTNHSNLNHLLILLRLRQFKDLNGVTASWRVLPQFALKTSWFRLGPHLKENLSEFALHYSLKSGWLWYLSSLNSLFLRPETLELQALQVHYMLCPPDFIYSLAPVSTQHFYSLSLLPS